MSYTTNIGALSFRYVDAAHVQVRPFEPLATFSIGDGESVATVDEDGQYYLVIDHRVRQDATARAEFWVASAWESAIEGLFVLADAAAPEQRPSIIGGFRSLANLIGGSGTGEYALAAGR